MCIQKYVRKIEVSYFSYQKTHIISVSCNMHHGRSTCLDMSRPPGSETSPYPDSWWDPEVQGDKIRGAKAKGRGRV